MQLLALSPYLSGPQTLIPLGRKLSIAQSRPCSYCILLEVVRLFFKVPTSCVAVDKLLNLSVLLLPHVLNGYGVKVFIILRCNWFL